MMNHPKVDTECGCCLDYCLELVFYALNTPNNQDGDGHLTNRDRDKAEMFNAFSVFNMNDGPRGSQCPELKDHDCENDQLPDNTKILWDLLLQLDPYKSMEPDGVDPRIRKELADAIAKPLNVF
ncbi:hypothetical protein WISP_46285 [Willisornis vidua]|uniref:Uncharacterized protein n=1 Tax=Willisornis vidua TaxID=1566151 RepID=A0ABQ9DF64_9PASS|nr:hypothetical protein WISP_46285 [Willisornis vidua]